MPFVQFYLRCTPARFNLPQLRAPNHRTMIVTHNSRKVKLVPVKYQQIQNITDHLEDFEHIRLSEQERESLDQELFRLAAENFLMLIAFKEPLVFEQVKDFRPLAAEQVKAGDEITYLLIMSNNMRIRCDEPVYSLSPVKIKSTAPPKVEQLTLFE